MAEGHENLKLTAKEIAAAFSDTTWSMKYPPIMSIEQAAELLQISKDTIYDWRSRGLLKGCCRKVGKHLRFFRDRLIQKLMNEGL